MMENSKKKWNLLTRNSLKSKNVMSSGEGKTIQYPATMNREQVGLENRNFRMTRKLKFSKISEIENVKRNENSRDRDASRKIEEEKKAVENQNFQIFVDFENFPSNLFMQGLNGEPKGCNTDFENTLSPEFLDKIIGQILKGEKYE